MKKNHLPIISLKDFQFNEEIQILKPKALNEKKHTLVIERRTEYLVFASARRVVNKCCATFGTSLNEARAFSRTITQATNKLPICLGTTSHPFVLFPTLSASKESAIWISYNAVQWFHPSSSVDCSITLYNNRSFITNISTASIQTQMARSTIINRYFKQLDRISSPQKLTSNSIIAEHQIIELPSNNN
ncbi:competence protein ComK [Kurthia sibirica]|uniref:Competence protein n=1 Tax=Kurthia sibirica TaxID=202750 RepID=A0A2U3AMR8_9BACL|nr:competence protein ComK [Kurthia sibirica]PWI25817.1 hypothetical protein DEX24_06335 [Kurthia sibirica]